VNAASPENAVEALTAGSGEPLSLITIYHTGAYSTTSAFRAAGYSVYPEPGVGMLRKIAQMQSHPRANMWWAHWSWIERCKWVMDRRVITILRDPVEIMISAYVRNMHHKAVRQAEQWMRLHRYRDRVDEWIDFRSIDFSRYGVGPIPHENATADHPLKQFYRDGSWREVRKVLGVQWDCLMTIRREVVEIFEDAGLRGALGYLPGYD